MKKQYIFPLLLGVSFFILLLIALSKSTPIEPQVDKNCTFITKSQLEFIFDELGGIHYINYNKNDSTYYYHDDSMNIDIYVKMHLLFVSQDSMIYSVTHIVPDSLKDDFLDVFNTKNDTIFYKDNLKWIFSSYSNDKFKLTAYYCY